MNWLKFNIFGTLLVIAGLSIVNFEHYLFFILLLSCYGLFKAMDLYYEETMPY